MRVHQTINILSVVLPIFHHLVFLIRYRHISTLTLKNRELDRALMTAVGDYKTHIFHKNILENLMILTNVTVENRLRDNNTGVYTTYKTMKKAVDSCNKQKEATVELMDKEKEELETFISEFDAWTQEINDLRAQLNAYNEICNYVKDSEKDKAKTLCEPLVMDSRK